MTPGIVMVATGTKATALLLPATVELGRRISAAGHVHEVDDERMSRDHATVRWDRGAWVIVDRDSRNGTFVDGVRIKGEVHARANAVVRLGHTVFVLLADAQGHPAPDGAHVVGPELARAYEQIRRNATSDTLLLLAEPGTGKELAARLYHASGLRSTGPFVAVNCAAIPEGMAERLLFGANRGAFSGAVDAFGHFQMAAGGTLFLDDVADLDPAVQTRLLRVIESRQLMPLGATTTTPIDLGIVGAGHRELRSAVADQRFGDALYKRLARVTVELPALRERKVDIARLVQRECAAVAPGVSPHARLLEACLVRPWPGNVRELRAAVRQAALAAHSAGRDAVRVEDLAATAGQAIDNAAETALEKPKPAGREIDKETIIAALERANGVVSVAARALGLQRTQLYRLLDKHGLTPGGD